MRKNSILAITLVLILPVALFTASCTKQAVQTQSESTTEPQPPVESTVAPVEPTVAPVEAAKETEQPQEDKLRTEIAAREAAEKAFASENVNFPFDSSALSDQAQQILNSKADYMRQNPGISITIEGYCDERGTDAYNIALGEKRAESVKTFLVNLGIGTDRMKTVSYGEERPLDTGHNEASWARNRRAQFVIN